MAGRIGAAVVLIRHLTKETYANSLYRGQGSMGIAGLGRGRCCWLGRIWSSHPRGCRTVIKSNLGEVPPALGYRLIDRGDVGAVEWLGPGRLVRSRRSCRSLPESCGPRYGCWRRWQMARSRRRNWSRRPAAAGIGERTLEKAKGQGSASS